jgi:hypothetical protein
VRTDEQRILAGQGGSLATRATGRPVALPSSMPAAAGLMIIDIKWGNIIDANGYPWWIDFHLAEDHSELSRESFRCLPTSTTSAFNRAFGTNLSTAIPAVGQDND